MTHHKQYILGLKLQNRIFWTLFISAMVGALLYITQEEVVSPCPEDHGCFVKTVRAEDIEKNTPKGIIEGSKHPEQLKLIHLKESSNGKNTNPNALHNICKAKGKSNEFGYGGMLMMICFDSFEESVRVVDAWLTKRDNEALCYYNLGIKTSDCDYIK